MQPRFPIALEQEGVRGESRFRFPPGGFAPLSTRESGLTCGEW